ncbi:hypothetical protein ACFLYN_05500 [Chloroflexota bacterium]
MTIWIYIFDIANKFTRNNSFGILSITMKERVVFHFKRIEAGMPYIHLTIGVRIRLHYTWLVVVVLITAAVVTQFSTDYPLWLRIMLGVAASVLYFLAIIIREFVINFLAINKGIVVRRVTLFAIGGVQDVDETSTRPSLDILLAVTGMLTNLVIAGIFYFIYTALVRSGSIVVHVLIQWLAFISLMLVFLHFVPGFPLDMGRILRALLWKATGNYRKMTRITGWIGWSIGLISSLGGIYIMVISQEWFTGVLFLFVGLILQNAVTHSRRQLTENNPV